MGLQIIVKKRFLNSFKKITTHISNEWGKNAAENFKELVLKKLNAIVSHPSLGVATSIKNTRSVLVGKNHQNKLYYRLDKDKIIIVDIKDTRRNPKKNPFNKPE